MTVSQKKSKPYTWRGKRSATTYLDPIDYKRLQEIAAENERSLMAELRFLVKRHLAAYESEAA